MAELAEQRLAQLTAYHYHMLEVFVDRSRWFSKGFEALSHDGMSAIKRLNPKLPDAAIKEMRVAYTYGAFVFTTSALESYLLIAYHNSVMIWKAWRQALPPRLEDWLNKQPSGRKGKSLEESLKSMTFSSLSQAAEWYGDIYGADCFSQALGNEKAYQELRTTFDNLVMKRNGILHRGGETKKGIFIDEPLEQLESERQQMLSFGQKFCGWSFGWWKTQMSKDPRLAQTIMSLGRGEA